MSRLKSSDRFRFSAASIALAALIFLIPALKNGNPSLYLLAVLVPCAMFLCGTVLARLFSLDRFLLSLVLWFCAAGIAAFAPSDPEAALTQALRCGAALISLLIGGMMVRSLSPSLLTSSCTAFLGLLILAGKLISPSLDLPLIQGAVALLLIAYASLFARQGPVSALFLSIFVLALLLLRGDTAEAVLWGLTVLLLAFAADGRLVVILPALAAVLLLFFVSFRLGTAPVFVQESSSLSALVSAGLAGTDMLPENLTAAVDGSLFTLLTGHYGLLFSGLTVLLFLPFFLRGSTVAGSARLRWHAMLAMGISLLFSFRTLTAVLSAFGILPLSGLSLPFLTASLPDLCAQLYLVGLLCGISGRNDADLAEDAHLAMLAK